MIGAWYPSKDAIITRNLKGDDLMCKCSICTKSSESSMYENHNSKVMYLDTLLIAQLDKFIDKLGHKPEIKFGHICEAANKKIKKSVAHQLGFAVEIKLSSKEIRENEQLLNDLFSFVKVRDDNTILLSTKQDY